MTFEIDGRYTNAKFMGVEPEQIEDGVIEQVQKFIDHPAFTEPVRMMADAHYGAGCAIGFTMPLADVDRVVPNAVGVDVGCGMFASNFGDVPTDEETLLELDEAIRERVPMGFSVHSDPDYHIVDDFPWDTCERKLERFRDKSVSHIDPEWFDGYDGEYFKQLCKRVGYDPNRAIASMGTAGGGNHFVEFGQSEETGDVWCIIHSGSRGIGAAIAEYWQDRATILRDHSHIQANFEDWMQDYVKFDVVNDGIDEKRQWVYGGMGEAFYDMDAVRADFEGEQIEQRRQQLKELIPDGRDEALDYLYGEEAAGYYVDMVFAQTYAQESRYEMMKAVQRALESVAGEELTSHDEIESVHNFIDFEDGVMRKGACRAHEGERIVIPLNMADGTLLARGSGDDEWNRSAPHGAGRIMSRTQAYNEVDLDDFEAEMVGVASTSVTEETLDEAPHAYKDAELIKNAVDGTLDVYDRLAPVLNIKALD